MDFFLQIFIGISFRQDKELVCFGDLDPIFKVTGEFSLKHVLNQWKDFT